MYLWSVFTRSAPFGCPGRQSCLHSFRLALHLAHRPMFSRLPVPNHSAASGEQLKILNLPSSVTATSFFFCISISLGWFLAGCSCKFFQPLDALRRPRLDIHSSHDLPLLCGSCPLRNRPVFRLYCGFIGGRYSSNASISKTC